MEGATTWYVVYVLGLNFPIVIVAGWISTGKAGKYEKMGLFCNAARRFGPRFFHRSAKCESRYAYSHLVRRKYICNVYRYQRVFCRRQLKSHSMGHHEHLSSKAQRQPNRRETLAPLYRGNVTLPGYGATGGAGLDVTEGSTIHLFGSSSRYLRRELIVPRKSLILQGQLFRTPVRATHFARWQLAIMVPIQLFRLL